MQVDPFVPQGVRERDDRFSGAGQRIERRNLRADVDVRADRGQAPPAGHLAKQRRRPSKGGESVEIVEGRGAASEVRDGPGATKLAKGDASEADPWCGEPLVGQASLDGELLRSHTCIGGDSQDDVGGWPAVGLVFDLNDPTAGLGAVGAFKNLANWTQMGGGMLVFSLDGKGPYDDVMLDEYPPELPKL